MTGSRVSAKEKSGFQTRRLSPNCEENKVISTIYQPIPPELTDPRAIIFHTSGGDTTFTVLLNLRLRKAEE